MGTTRIHDSPHMRPTLSRVKIHQNHTQLAKFPTRQMGIQVAASAFRVPVPAFLRLRSGWPAFLAIAMALGFGVLELRV